MFSSSIFMPSNLRVDSFNFNFEIYKEKAFDKVEINELENGK